MFWNTGEIETLAPNAIYDSSNGTYTVYGRYGIITAIYQNVYSKNMVIIAIRKIK